MTCSDKLRTTTAFLILLLPCLVFADCNDDARIRIIKGDKKKAERLYMPIMGKFPSWAKDFHEEEFTYVGSLENGIEVALLYTSWGASTCRGTTRLMLFRKGKYLGAYGVDSIDGALKLVGNKIIFPYKADIGNVIDLSGRIPHEILLGGQLPVFMPSESSK
jgi:hypothetical protein